MLPYDGMTRTGSKGVSHSALAETPSEARKVLERHGKGKLWAAFTQKIQGLVVRPCGMQYSVVASHNQ